jgi:hypothetical protein
LSALRTGRLYSQAIFLVLIYVRRLSQPQGHSAAGRMSIKNCNDTIGNRTRDLPACSAVSQPTAPPSAPYMSRRGINLIGTPLIRNSKLPQKYARTEHNWHHLINPGTYFPNSILTKSTQYIEKLAVPNLVNPSVRMVQDSSLPYSKVPCPEPD